MVGLLRNSVPQTFFDRGRGQGLLGGLNASEKDLALRIIKRRLFWWCGGMQVKVVRGENSNPITGIEPIGNFGPTKDAGNSYSEFPAILVSRCLTERYSALSA